MILERKTINNGYGCSCCRNDYRTSDWIKEDEMKSFEEIVNYIFSKKYFKDGDIHSELIYEKDGKIIYGFYVEVYKVSSVPFIYIKDKTLKITENTKKEEVFELYKKENYPGLLNDWKGMAGKLIIDAFS